jgi:3',5'-cyclic AMP phosphodiesterase CpdA
MKRIAFLTDIHLDEKLPFDHHVDPGNNLKRVLSDLSSRGIKEIVFGGDIGEATSHLEFFKTLKPYSLKLILGNHDKLEEVRAHYRQEGMKDQLYYSYEEDNFKYVFLDSSSEEVSTTQLKWLAEELKASKKMILFIHHPVLPINTPADKHYPLKNREEVKQVLLACEKEVSLFCGHYHMNDECTYRNIKQFTTQSLCFQLVKSADRLEFDHLKFGYRIITIDNETVETGFIAFDTPA